VDYVTFTSASSVRNLLDSLGEGAARTTDGSSSPGRQNPTASAGGALAGARVVSIGPVTTAEARALGLEVDVEADRHDVEGLVAALVADAEATA
jgi:uroporphyrinogen III methyltransferase/synthase